VIDVPSAEILVGDVGIKVDAWHVQLPRQPRTA
jgi:hypothetical protein